MTRETGQRPGLREGKLLVLVGGIIVEDDMDRPIGRDLTLDSIKKANEFEMAVALQRSGII
jgi:hypothetical protein